MCADLNSSNTIVRRWRFGVVLLGMVWLGLTQVAAAECGEIIREFSGEEERESIVDCVNPFAVTLDPSFSVEHQVNGIVIADGSELVATSTGQAFEISAQVTPTGGEVTTSLYQHEGADYRQVRGPTENDITLSATGTYTVVTEVITIGGTGAATPSLFDRVQRWLLPVAHAQIIPITVERFATTFTITYEPPEPEPTGASSVLFLPGIQASRLYKDGLLGEDQLWTPTNIYSQDIRQLAMDETGQSVNDIYTRDVLDQVPGVGSIYSNLLDHFEELVNQEVISDYRAFAYDWRFSPDTIVQNGVAYEEGMIDLVETVESLAKEAAGESVTIVSHSNGGLVAKALVAELEKQGKEELIDQMIFIGTPHIGTPKAIGTVLHGYDQAVSVTRLELPVIQADVARAVINNLPGAYGLVPTPAYWEAYEEPLIGIENATATAELFAEYGSLIDDYEEFTRFLRGDDDLNRELNQSISVPTTVNEDLFELAVDEHTDLLDDWQAPEHIAVTQLVGVGLPTLSLIEYRQVIENDCTVIPGGQIVCVPREFLKPFAYFSNDGDETVMSLSAEAYAGASEVYYVDMLNVQPSGDFQIGHVSMTEFDDIHSLISDLFKSTTSEYSYLSKIKPTVNTNFDIEVIDSPLTLLATDETGNQTGVIEENGERVIVTEIPGSQYLEFGGSKYFIVPSDVEREVVLIGEAVGGYTLTLATLESDNETIINSVLQNATVTPTTRITYEKNASGYSTLKTDFDGDGVIDLETTPDGDLIKQPEVVTYDRLRDAVDDLQLPWFRERLLERLIDRAERLGERDYGRLERKTLRVMKRVLRIYQRFDLITREERQVVRDIINKLRHER